MKIDLRSDTVTLPTEEMLEAIKNAKLGDDFYGEDSTVNQLEQMAAEKMGKDAALLVPSGTQANLISLMANCERGELVVLEAESHVYWYEVGGISSVAGLLPWPIKAPTGIFGADDLEKNIRSQNISFPNPRLICVENTHNRYGGLAIKPRQIEAVSRIAKQKNLKVYMDGARIFNAAIALGEDPKEFTKHVDNLMFCLSKSLCCPVGSLVVGDFAFIEKARKIRKLLGGQMRQAGVIAVPGIIALEKMINRLKEDHDNAAFLAEKISKLSGITIDPSSVQTNIVTFELDSKIDERLFLEKLEEQEVLALPISKNKIRFVTHRGIQRSDLEKTAAAVEEILSAWDF